MSQGVRSRVLHGVMRHSSVGPGPPARPVEGADLLDVPVVMNDQPAVAASTRLAPNRPERRAILDSVSASSALGPSAVTPTSPSRRAGRWRVEQVVREAPLPSRQTRTFKPEVAIPPPGRPAVASPLSGCSISTSYGSSGRRRRRSRCPRRSRRRSGCSREAERYRVGTQALAGAARVELDARRAGDGSPLRRPIRAARRLRGAAEPACAAARGDRLVQRGGTASVERARVTGLADRARQRRINQSAAALGRPQPRADGRPKQWRGLHAPARVAVERAQLAVGAKAREPRGEVLDEGMLALRGCGRRGRAGKQRASDQQTHVAAHRMEAELVFDAHETRVIGAEVHRRAPMWSWTG